MKARLSGILALVLALAATAGAQPALVPLHLAASPVDDVMPVLYALRAGLFQKAGLDVTMDRANSGGALAAAVAGGSVDIGKGNVMTIVSAHAHGVPLVLVAPAAIYDPRTPDAVLVTRKDSPLASARDLVGKTVGVPSISDLSTVAVEAWMESNGVDWHGTQFVEIGYPAMLPALEQGRVQAATLIKPFITDGVESGKAKVLGLFYSAVSSRFLESAWFADTAFVEKHRDTVATFQRVIAQASAYTNSHQSETVDLLATWANIDPTRAKTIPRIVTGTTLDVRDVQPVIDIAAKYSLIAKSFDARDIIVR